VEEKRGMGKPDQNVGEREKGQGRGPPEVGKIGIEKGGTRASKANQTEKENPNRGRVVKKRKKRNEKSTRGNAKGSNFTKKQNVCSEGKAPTGNITTRKREMVVQGQKGRKRCEKTQQRGGHHTQADRQTGSWVKGGKEDVTAKRITETRGLVKQNDPVQPMKKNRRWTAKKGNQRLSKKKS